MAAAKHSSTSTATKQVAESELQLHLKQLVGKTFYKEFPGHGKYKGTIKKLHKETSLEGSPMFHVKYEDGETEDLTTWELVECGITVPVARASSHKKRQTSIPQVPAPYPGGDEVLRLLLPATAMCNEDASKGPGKKGGAKAAVPKSPKKAKKSPKKKKSSSSSSSSSSGSAGSTALVEAKHYHARHRPLLLDAVDYGTLVSVWMFARRFSQVLKLSRFSLQVFEDAMMFDGSSVLLEDTVMAMVRVLLESDAYHESATM